MNLRRLYRTIESFASEHFRTDKEVLKHIVNEIVKDENINIKGGAFGSMSIHPNRTASFIRLGSSRRSILATR